MKKIYFPNLNGLRFFAALLVVVHHIEQFKYMLGYNNFWTNGSVKVIGKLGVVLFFVLSGFLITYLLLAEEKEFNKISIKDFYIRRVLRIWPLYYLILILSFFFIPNIHIFNLGDISSALQNNFFKKIVLFIFFLPNLALSVYSPVPFASQSWSVGVEEQFYLLWPIVLSYTKKRVFLFLSIIILYGLLKYWVFPYAVNHEIGGKTLFLVQNFWALFNINCMAIGGVFAWLVFTENRLLKFIFSKYIQIFTIVLLVVFIAIGFQPHYLYYETYSLLFALLITNLAVNPNTILSLENFVFDYLGKISYGIYMYHSLCIVLVLKLIILVNINSFVIEYIGTIALTIIVAGLSYRFYENYFIKKKTQFSRLLSGNIIDKV